LPIRKRLFSSLGMIWKVSEAELVKRGPLVDVTFENPATGKKVKGKGLIDTGAGGTAIIPHVVSDLNLTHDGKTAQTKGIGHTAPVASRRYDLHVTVHLSDGDDSEKFAYRFTDVRVAELGSLIDGEDVLCLIGRDILYAFKFCVDGKGEYSLEPNRE
jgi:hypothetical protein